MRLSGLLASIVLAAYSVNAFAVQSTPSELVIFGPKSYRPGLVKPITYNTTFLKKTNPEPYKLVIQNGSGKDFTFDDCSKQSGLKKILCLAHNVVTTVQVSLDRAASGTIKVNGVSVASISLSTSTLVVPLSGLKASNALSISLRGLPTASVKVEIRAPAVSVNLPPVAIFSMTPNSSAVAPATVAFNAMGSSDPDAGDSIASYQWSFGDGTTGSGLLINHVYTSAGTYTVKLTVTDTQGASASSSETLTVKQNVAPIAKASATPLNGEAPLNVNFSAQGSSDSDGTIASYQWNFGDGASGTGSNAAHTYTSVGTFTAVLTVTDDKGTTATASVSIQTFTPNAKPTAVLTASRTSGIAPLMVAFDAAGSNDSDGSIAKYQWNFGDGTTAETTTPTATHEFGVGQYQVVLIVVDNRGAQNSAAVSISSTQPQVPADPVTLAPALSQTTLSLPADMTKFLYTGPNAIQIGVADGTIDNRFVSVIRGQVVDENGQPISGVSTKILNHAEFGSTLTRVDGWFDLAVNGGEPLTVNFERSGYYQVQRIANPMHQGFASLDKIFMLRPDPVVTEIAISSPTAQVAQGSVSNDKDGSRTATVMFPANTGAQLRMPNGSLKTVPSLHVRAKEYTVGENGPSRMPASLPSTSAYTYAVQLTADEVDAFGAKGIQFSKPVSFYVDNFLGFDIGDLVPVGIYNPEKGRWEASKNGRVIKILAVKNSKADLDVTGSGMTATATELSALGIEDQELEQIATKYAAGKSIWRVQLDHFSEVDLNWFETDVRSVNSGTGDPKSPDAKSGGSCSDDPKLSGSIIGASARTLGEELDVQGAPFSLVYNTQRMPGRVSAKTIDIPVTGADLTNLPNLTGVDLKVTVAGKAFEKHYTPAPNLFERFVWDGRDAYGRRVYTPQIANVEITYRLAANYLSAGRLGADPIFAVLGTGLRLTAIPSRQETLFEKSFSIPVGTNELVNDQEFGGWTLDIHHTYDPVSKTLFMGDAQKVSAREFGNVVNLVAGTGLASFSGDGGPATQAMINSPYDLAIGKDNSVYFRDGANFRIRKIDPDGIITTIAGIGRPGVPISNVPATISPVDTFGGLAFSDSGDGTLYFADSTSNLIRQIDKSGFVKVVAGQPGVPGFAGDGGPAHLATLNAPYSLVSIGGSIYFNDSGNNRVRVISPDGLIHTVAGNGQRGYAGDDGPAIEASIAQPLGLAAGPNGDLYITDSNNGRVRRIDRGGIIRTVAGGGINLADGIPATNAAIGFPTNVAFQSDGSMLIARSSPSIKRVSPQGIISTYAGSTTSTTTNQIDGELAGRATLANPYFIAVGPDDSLYMSEDNRIRKVVRMFQGVGNNEIVIPSRSSNEVFVFDMYGRHLRTLNSMTGAIRYQFAYSADGRLASVTDGDNNKTAITRDSLGRATEILAPFGQRSAFTYGSDGYLASITNEANETHRMSYNSGGLLISFQKPKGNYSTFSYDAQGQLTSDLDQRGGGTYLDRVLTASGYRTTIRTADGVTSQFSTTVGAAGNSASQFVFADGRTVTTNSFNQEFTSTNDSSSKVTVTNTKSADPRFGAAQSYTASLREISSGLNTQIEANRTVTVDPQNRFLFSQTDTLNVNGAVSTSTFDSTTRTFVATSAVNRTISTTFDAQMRPLKFTLDSITPIENVYDSRGRLISTTQGDRTVSYAYNSKGLVSEVSDALGNSTTYIYDSADRIVSEVRPDSSVVNFAYDSNGNMIGVVPPTRPLHAFEFDVTDLITEYTPPGSNDSSVFNYTLDRKLASVAQPDGTYANISYDSVTGKEASRATSEGAQLRTYGPQGYIGSETSPDGIRLAYEYDADRLRTETSSGRDNSYSVFAYDVNKQISSVTVGGSAIAYGYDQDRLLSTAGPLTYGYAAKTALLNNVSVGQLATSRAFNAFGELAAEQTSIGSTMIASFTYDRDKLGRVIKKTESSTSGTITKEYSYLPSGALWMVKRNGIAIGSYTYDQNGNRTSTTTEAGAAIATFDSQDRLLTFGSKAYSYNAKGDLAKISETTGDSTFKFDVNGLLKSTDLKSGQKVGYLYDARGRRRTRLVNGVRNLSYVYQGQLQLAAVIDVNNKVKQFIYGSRSNVPDAMIADGQTYRFITDQVGSVRFVLNASTGAVVQEISYDEFGRVLSDSSPGFQPFGFAGGIYDSATGLVQFGARWYDPQVGRFLSKDPILFNGGDTNLYGYVMNDPINLIDPSGLIFQRVIAKYTTPEQQAAGGAAALIGGFGAAVAGLKTLNPYAFLGGLAVAWEGGNNLTYAVKTRGAENPFDQINPFKEIRDFSDIRPDSSNTMRCER